MNGARRGWLAAACGIWLAASAALAQVRLGVDVLERDGFGPLTGKRVGLITNPTGTNSRLRSTVDVLHEAPGVRLVALFGPEHGVRGAEYAGDKVDQAVDERTGLPVHSLYGQTRIPTPEMLAGLDALVFDTQDIGSRSYTYIATMANAMAAAAEHGLEFIVLDRPNPLGGLRVEGRPLDVRFRSFVGPLPIPYLHGLTVAELAKMIVGEGWLVDPLGAPAGRELKLTCVALEGWRREMLWSETGLPWTPTSPHIPRHDSSAFYATTGILGELGVISEGVGYTLPFELLGRPGWSAEALADDLNARRLAGVFFRPIYFKPFYGRFQGQMCGGVQIHLLDPRGVELTPIQFHALDAARKLEEGFDPFANKRSDMFDKVCGTDGMRRLLEAGRPVEELLAFWNEGVEEFRQRRSKYLMYE